MIQLNYRNMLLWRHADAEPITGTNELDSARPLSKKGLKQAEKVAIWLADNMPEDTMIITSNALRAEQTVQALKREYIVFASLAPEASLEDVIQTISQLGKNKLQCENLLVVGHQPWLGLLAAQLLSFPRSLNKNSEEISIKKGAVWQFKRPTLQKNQPFKLVTVLSPSTL